MIAMPVLQLVERPGPSGYVLDVVEAQTTAASEEPTSERELLPLSAGSSSLLYLAAFAPTIGLRAVRVHVADRSGRPTGESGSSLEDALLILVREGEAEDAVATLNEFPQLYVERIGLENPQTRAVVTCTRHGLISLQGPAVEETTNFVAALLQGFSRVLGFTD